VPAWAAEPKHQIIDREHAVDQLKKKEHIMTTNTYAADRTALLIVDPRITSFWHNPGLQMTKTELQR
jgi:hypothetical protein